jgi:cell division protein FtsQ
MAHNAAMHVMGQGSQMGPDQGVREETVLMLKRVLFVMTICFALIVLITKRDTLVQIVDHPVSSIKVTGAFSYLKETEVTQALAELVGSGFLATDLEDVQARVEALPWVNTATVSRVWPGEVKLLINEQVAVSQWNDGSLLNEQGIVFTPAELGNDLLVLPKLIGSESFSSAKKNMMFSTLGSLQQGLAPYGLSVSALELKPRNVWNMTLSNGVAVSIGDIKLDTLEGQQTLDAKIERVGKVFNASTGIDTNNIARIDARYPNGVAIKWRNAKVNK